MYILSAKDWTTLVLSMPIKIKKYIHVSKLVPTFVSVVKLGIIARPSKEA